MMGSVVFNILIDKENASMKVKLNPMFEQVSGQLGELVFREVRGETVASRKPSVSGEPSADQTAQRELFKQAAAYGKSVMADASVRAVYEEIAKSKNIPVFALTVADFFNAPSIDTIDLSAYNGQAGNPISILAHDDVSVMNVHVRITNPEGATLESGAAVETSTGSGRWVYTAVSTFAAGYQVNVEVVATDRPGGSTVSKQSKTF
jgi:hypothetical protein